MSTSGKLAAAARTRTSTCPGPGSGSRTSASASTSRGSPSSCTCHALTVSPLSPPGRLPGAPLARSQARLLDPLLHSVHSAQPPIGVLGPHSVVVAYGGVRQDQEPAVGQALPERLADLLGLDRGLPQHD